jgi:hypothetical protein
LHVSSGDAGEGGGLMFTKLTRRALCVVKTGFA